MAYNQEASVTTINIATDMYTVCGSVWYCNNEYQKMRHKDHIHNHHYMQETQDIYKTQ